MPCMKSNRAFGNRLHLKFQALETMQAEQTLSIILTI